MSLPIEIINKWLSEQKPEVTRIWVEKNKLVAGVGRAPAAELLIGDQNNSPIDREAAVDKPQQEKPSEPKTFVVNSSGGSFVIDRSGYILESKLQDDDLRRYQRFDVAEYFHHYASQSEDEIEEFDIMDLGAWIAGEDGKVKYEPADARFREDVAEYALQLVIDSRVQVVSAVIELYLDKLYAEDHRPSTPHAACLLLGDLMHYASSAGISFCELLQEADSNYRKAVEAAGGPFLPPGS